MGRSEPTTTVRFCEQLLASVSSEVLCSRYLLDGVLSKCSFSYRLMWSCTDCPEKLLPGLKVICRHYAWHPVTVPVYENCLSIAVTPTISVWLWWTRLLLRPLDNPLWHTSKIYYFLFAVSFGSSKSHDHLSLLTLIFLVAYDVSMVITHTYFLHTPCGPTGQVQGWPLLVPKVTATTSNGDAKFFRPVSLYIYIYT